MMPPCPFCDLPAERIVHTRDTAFVIRDGFPVSPGHTLIIPRRHVASFFEVSDAERVRAEVWIGGKEYGRLSAGWRRLLPGAAEG